MRPLSKRHAAILDKLTTGLDDEHPHRKIDNAPGAFMAAVIEKIAPERFSVAHYFEQNGDLVADPDLEFVRQDGGWFPVAITQLTGYHRVAETSDDGRIVAYNRARYADLRSFAGLLLGNIKAQQRDLTPKPAAGSKGGKG
jgi:hypothetical protein